MADEKRRSLFDMFRDPERLGRELGRAYRGLNELVNPPSVSQEEYEQNQQLTDAFLRRHRGFMTTDD